MITDYHAKYFAHELTKRCAPDSVEKLAGAVAGAQVDLNPHQVDAALFAFSSPLSKGALLADEVGLGKTIEAGLVISQRWAERKRRILIITPSRETNHLSEVIFATSKAIQVDRGFLAIFRNLTDAQPLAEKVLLRLAELDAAKNSQAPASAAAPAIATAATDQT